MTDTQKQIDDDVTTERLAGPRVTLADIESNIASEHYFTALQGALRAAIEHKGDANRDLHPLRPELGLLTFCVLTLRNGFTVTGESACVSHLNFDAIMGRQVARENAVAKIWTLMGYALKNRICEGHEDGCAV